LPPHFARLRALSQDAACQGSRAYLRSGHHRVVAKIAGAKSSGCPGDPEDRVQASVLRPRQDLRRGAARPWPEISGEAVAASSTGNLKSSGNYASCARWSAINRERCPSPGVDTGRAGWTSSLSVSGRQARRDRPSFLAGPPRCSLAQPSREPGSPARACWLGHDRGGVRALASPKDPPWHALFV
jgi:hypothetical protein